MLLNFLDESAKIEEKNLHIYVVKDFDNWIKINLEGSKNNISNEGWSPQSNKSAIGARVVVTLFEGSIQSREIISGKGHGSMDALELHYGLGYASQIQNIIVRWPSKDSITNQQKVITYNGPFSVNETYRIVEDLGFVGAKGDYNQDESVDILDVMSLIDIVLNDFEITPDVHWAVDMNGISLFLQIHQARPAL